MTDTESETDFLKSIVSLYNSKEFIDLNAYYNKKSVFEILGVDRDENTHSNFLAWLLNENESHGLGQYPMEKFLQLLMVAREFDCNKNVEINIDMQHQLLIGNKKIETIKKLLREKAIVGGKSGRIDIYLEITFKDDDKILPIIIENKIKSDEYDEQTDNYYKWAEMQFSDKTKYSRPLFVFLSPKYKFESYSGNRSVICKNNFFILISYQNILDYVIEPCIKKAGTEQGKILLNDYIRCLSYSDITNEDDTNHGKGDYIMGIGENERKLLKSFWEKNNALIMATIEAIINDDDTTDDERKKLKNSQTILGNHKDYSKYSIAGEGKYGKCPLPLEVIKKYLKDHEKISISDFEKKFPKDLHNIYDLYRKFSTIEDNKKRNYYCKDSELITIENEKYAVCNQWGIDNIPTFIDYVNKYFSEYKIEKVE